MAVSLDEPRHGEPPIQLDDFGFGTDEGGDLLVAAHRHDPPAPDRHRLGHGVVRVDRGDDSAPEDEVGGSGVVPRAGGEELDAGHGERGDPQPGRSPLAGIVNFT